MSDDQGQVNPTVPQPTTNLGMNASQAARNGSRGLGLLEATRPVYQ